MSRFIKASSTYASDKMDGPERRLFIAVLSQAVHDAFSSHVPGLEKRQAQAWLMGNSEDFKIICENAGRDAKYVLTPAVPATIVFVVLILVDHTISCGLVGPSICIPKLDEPPDRPAEVPEGLSCVLRRICPKVATPPLAVRLSNKVTLHALSVLYVDGAVSCN